MSDSSYKDDKIKNTIRKELERKSLYTSLHDQQIPFYFSGKTSVESRKGDYLFSFSPGYFTLCLPKRFLGKRKIFHHNWLELRKMNLIDSSTINLQFRADHYTITIQDTGKKPNFTKEIFNTIQLHLHKISDDPPEFFNGSSRARLQINPRKFLKRPDIALQIRLDNKQIDSSFFTKFALYSQTFSMSSIKSETNIFQEIFECLPLMETIQKFVITAIDNSNKSCIPYLSKYLSNSETIKTIVFKKRLDESIFSDLSKCIPKSVNKIVFIEFKFEAKHINILYNILQKMDNGITLKIINSMNSFQFKTFVDMCLGQRVLSKVSKLNLILPDQIDLNIIPNKINDLQSLSISSNIQSKDILTVLNFETSNLKRIKFSHVEDQLKFIPNASFSFPRVIEQFAITNTKWDVHTFIYVFKECFNYNYSYLEIDFSDAVMSTSDWETFFDGIKDLAGSANDYITRIKWNNNPVTNTFWDICVHCTHLLEIKAENFRSINSSTPLPIPLIFFQKESIQRIILPNSYTPDQIQEIANRLYHSRAPRLQTIDFSGFTLAPKSTVFSKFAEDLQSKTNIITCNLAPAFESMKTLTRFKYFLNQLQSMRSNGLSIYWPGNSSNKMVHKILLQCSQEDLVSMYQATVEIAAKPQSRKLPAPIPDPDFGKPGSDVKPLQFQTIFLTPEADSAGDDADDSPYSNLTDTVLPGTFDYFITKIQNAGLVSSPEINTTNYYDTDLLNDWKDRLTMHAFEKSNVYAPPLEEIDCIEEFMNLTKVGTINFT